MTERAGRIAVLALAGSLAALSLSVDLPGLSGGRFWSDAATYYSMAWSLAEDGDLRYETRDLLRVKREYPSGPGGILLKRASGGLMVDTEAGFPWIRRVPESGPRIYYAKAFAYPAVAAPFVKLLGTRGLLLTNAIFLGLALVLGYSELRQRASPAGALAVALVLFVGTVTPLYVLWLHPEILNLGLITAGLVAGRKRPVLAAILFGIATYSKPNNVFLALPLGLEPLLESGRTWGLRFRESVRRGLVVVATTLALFGLNTAITGEWNYQGGERKTFRGKFPLDTSKVTFGNSGEWMTTDHVGPLVEGQDEAKKTRRTGPLRSSEEIHDSLLRNLVYFWIGRYGGAVPYFFPVVLAVLLFLARGPRDRHGWLALLSLLVSYVFYVWMIPDNWYGGGGTVGNRYFLNLLPLGLFLVPRGREWLVAAGGAVAAAVFVVPILAAPVAHSIHPGDHAMTAAYRLFPAELTMLNDLSFNADPWRKKVAFGDTEGDPHKLWPPDPKAYFLYFPDDGTYGKEAAFGQEGFWLRGGQEAEVILRALHPVLRMKVTVRGGPVGDEVTVRLGAGESTVSVAADQEHEMTFVPDRPYVYYDTFVHVLELRSRRGGMPRPLPGVIPDGRRLGAFVRLALDVERR